MQFEVFGTLRATGPDGPIRLARGQNAAVLSWLLLNAGDVVSIDSVIDVLWERPARNAATKAKAVIREVAQQFPAGTIEKIAGGARIDPDCHDVDSRTFEDAVMTARGQVAQGSLTLARDGFERALSMWHGDPYPDLKDVLVALPTINRLVDLRQSVYEELNAIALQAEVGYPLVAEVRSQMTLHPQRSRLRRQLAVALYRVDRQVEALEVLRQTRLELGDVDGSARRLETAILQNDPDLERGELDA